MLAQIQELTDTISAGDVWSLGLSVGAHVMGMRLLSCHKCRLARPHFIPKHEFKWWSLLQMLSVKVTCSGHLLGQCNSFVMKCHIMQGTGMVADSSSGELPFTAGEATSAQSPSVTLELEEVDESDVIALTLQATSQESDLGLELSDVGQNYTLQRKYTQTDIDKERAMQLKLSQMKVKSSAMDVGNTATATKV